jgi:opacity protein-like surface antigen
MKASTFPPAAQLSVVICICLLLAIPSLWAQAPNPSRGRASGTAGWSLGDGGTAPSFGLALSYWPARRVGVEFELAYSKNLEFILDLCPPPLVCVFGGQVPVKGRTLSLIPHLVVEPTDWERFHPYVLAGVGFGHLRQRYTVNTVVPSEFTRSKKALALSVGAGFDLRVTRRLRLGLDIRSRQLFDEEPHLDRYIVPAGTLSAVRIGSHASWKF